MENKIIEWGDKKLILHEFKLSHANGGRLEKFWVEDILTGRQFLIKGSTAFSYEPLCEKMAYIIGKNLGIDVLEYDILPLKLFKDIVPMNPLCKYVSICEKIDRKNYSITSVAEIKRARNIVREKDEKPITNKEVMYEILDEKYITTMLLFDAIIGNTDRHYGNVHILRSKDGDMIGAPLLDNGASLLAQVNTIIAYCFKSKLGETFNSSSTTQNTHDKQLAEIGKMWDIEPISFDIPVKTIQILDEIQPVLDLMPKMRAEITKRYITYRLHKYLGILKYGISNDLDKLSNNKTTSTKNEKEHT